MKNRNAGIVLLFIVLNALIISGCQSERYKDNGIKTDMFTTDTITLFSDGYYEHTLEQPIVITDEETIVEIVEIASRVNEYSIVSEDELLEGLNGLWIDFNNGTVIGMYKDVDYGNLSDGIKKIDSPSYYLPKGLRGKVIGIFEENVNVVTITTDISSYTPAMSSVKGITMTPNLKTDKSYNKLEYHWLTEKGEFCGKGTEVNNKGEEVTWSAISDERVIEITSEFNIYLEVVDIESEKVIANTKIIIKPNNGFYEVKK